MWIDPTNGQRMLLGLDQGAVVSLDGGGTWTSWYNQSTEQVYHIAVDNSYPYWVYASQQDAGAIRTRSRGNLGEITALDWNPVSGWEWGTTIPDPLNPNIVYASGSGILKITYPSEQWIDVSPNRDPKLYGRTTVSQPLAFAPWNQHELLAGFQFVMATVDGGVHWTKLSPDLGFPKGATVPPDSMRGRGAPGTPFGSAIQSMALSTVKPGVIWVGTNLGLIKLTTDEGKTWQDVTIPDLPPRADILSLDASHFDAATAYAVADRHTSGDYKPYVYRTHDYGKTWTLITTGLATDQPSGSYARVVRNDTKKQGLLFAGTESGMYVSFDDGDNWQSLQLNLPNTSFRDIVVKGNDLVVGTYGRGIWVLDDISPLRQITATTASEPVHLFAPGDAMRVRRNVGADTPFPPEVPHALNPPDGAIIYYWLGSRANGRVTMEVVDSTGAVVRHYSSDPIPPVPEAAKPPHPNFWVKVEQPLPTDAGMHRVNWDLRYDPPPAFVHTFEINANPGLTPASPEGAVVPPGTYTVRLTANGKTQSEKVLVTTDPRSPVNAVALRAEDALIRKLYASERLAWDAFRQTDTTRVQLRAIIAADTTSPVAKPIKEYLAKLDTVGGTATGNGFAFGGAGFGASARPTFVQLVNGFLRQLETFAYGDIAPTPAMYAAYRSTCNDLVKAVAAWSTANGADLSALNAALSAAGKNPLAKAVG